MPIKETFFIFLKHIFPQNDFELGLFGPTLVDFRPEELTRRIWIEVISATNVLQLLIILCNLKKKWTQPKYML